MDLIIVEPLSSTSLMALMPYSTSEEEVVVVPIFETAIAGQWSKSSLINLIIEGINLEESEVQT